MVACPIFQANVPLNLINRHLDSQCGKKSEEPSKQGSLFTSLFHSSQKRKHRDVSIEPTSGKRIAVSPESGSHDARYTQDTQSATDAGSHMSRHMIKPVPHSSYSRNGPVAAPVNAGPRKKASKPLAEKVRPRNLSEVRALLVMATDAMGKLSAQLNVMV